MYHTFLVWQFSIIVFTGQIGKKDQSKVWINETAEAEELSEKV